MHYLKIKLKELSFYQILITYFGFLLIVSLPAIYYVILYVETSPNLINDENQIILKNLKFDYGSLLNNLYYNNSYVQKLKNFDLDFHLARMPFYPVLLWSLSKISLNFYFIFFSKNLLTFSLLFFCVFIFLKNIDKTLLSLILFLGLFIYNPYNLHILFSLDFADTIISILFPLVLLFGLNRDFKYFFILPLIIFILYLTKSSMWFFCIFFSIIYFFIKYYRNSSKFEIKYITPILSVICAILIWGFFGLNKSNYFPIGTSISSTNTYYLNSIMNKKFNNTYPQQSVDILIDRKFDFKKFNNEYEFHLFFKKKNFEFIKNNSRYYFEGIKKKVNFIFYGIKKDGNFNKKVDKIRFSNIPNKLFMNFALIFAVVYLLLNFKKKNVDLEMIYLSMFIFYLPPYLIAWATTKHLVPLFLLSKVYLLLKLLRA